MKVNKEILLEGDVNPLAERAKAVIAERYQHAGDFEDLCSGWPCDEIRWMAYRIAELEAKCEHLRASQCRCPKDTNEQRN